VYAVIGEVMNIHPVIELTDEIYEAFLRLIPQLSSLKPPTWNELSEIISTEATTLLLARQSDEKIVATLTLTCFRVPTGLRALIEDLVVDESARGQGIASELTSAALDIAKDYGANGVMLTSNPLRVAANKLYQKMGFKHWKTNVYFYKF
jgi:ribosomal protein S18 acetylase RimI-like enzyme